MKRQAKTETIDIDYLRERLHYDPETGKLFWKDCEAMPKYWRTRWANKEAFTTLKLGYLSGMVCSIEFGAHRAAWAVHYGKWPDGEIDHINGVRTDNRISNLREVSHQENMKNATMKKNNTSGVTGVFWHKPRKKWQVRIWVDQKNKSLGYYDTIEEATKVRQEANEKYGFTERHGKPLDTK